MAPETAAATAAGVSVTSTGIGITIGQINQYLQAFAFVVAMLSGYFAARYYRAQAKLAEKLLAEKSRAP